MISIKSNDSHNIFAYSQKKLPEKRHRPTLPKLYVKNACNLHPKSPNGNISPNGNGNGNVSNINTNNTNGKDGLEPQSPLFHIR